MATKRKALGTISKRFLMTGAALLCFSSVSYAQQSPVNFSADHLSYDEQEEVVTAIGNVRLEQEGRVISADSILYKLNEDQVTAVGNVVLVEPDGSRYTADKVRLREKFREGYVSYLQGVLPDGGRFASSYAVRSQDEGDQIIMKDASYTACSPCKKDTDKSPAWQLKAERVVHDRADKEVRYNNAKLELAGVPVLYTPYFSHPDGTEDQKSGLVEPVLGFDSEQGAFVGASYYYAIAPDKDATIGITAYSNEFPLLNGEYRQRFDNASLEFSGTTTYSNRVVSVGGANVELEDELRGSIEASGRLELNEKWRTGFDLNVTSDDQYLRQYDLSDDDVLESQVFVERFSGRNYADLRLIGFQDTRLISEQTDSPNILPEMSMSFLGEPDQTLGGRWSFGLSALSLQRDGSDPDTNRVSTELGWQRHEKFSSGLVSTLDLAMRGDYYYLTDQGVNNDETEMRAFAFANLETSYPLIRHTDQNGSYVVLEPVVSVMGVTRDQNQNEIGNEDSLDSELDSNNLFNPNRFSGFDRFEDRSRVTYGLRSTYYSYGDFEIGAFGGQSYNFEKDTTFFADRSGLSEQSSDYVAEVNARYGTSLDLNYRTRLDRNSFASRSHELDLGYSGDQLDLYGLYFFSKGVEGSDFEETRQQLQTAGRWRFADNWAFESGVIYDLGVDPGLREADFGIEYIGECFSIGTFVQRDLTNDNSGDADTEISIRIGLKNLGNFEATTDLLLEDEED